MNKSHLLINDPPLLFQPSLACKIGVDEAIVIQQLHYWLTNPKSEGRFENGEKWVYNTYETWKEDNFPFWSTDKIQRIFLNLEKLGVVVSAQLDAKRRDMKKFYRIDYDKLCAMDDAFLRPSNTANLHDVKMNQRLPENTNTTSTELSLENQIYTGQKTIVMPDEFERKARDIAGLIGTGLVGADELALAFMMTRRILLTVEQAKGQRKPAQQMLENGVRPEHVKQAIINLKEKNMTVSSLYSVQNTAIDLANAMNQSKPAEDYTGGKSFHL